PASLLFRSSLCRTLPPPRPTLFPYTTLFRSPPLRLVCPSGTGGSAGRSGSRGAAPSPIRRRRRSRWSRRSPRGAAAWGRGRRRSSGRLWRTRTPPPDTGSATTRRTRLSRLPAGGSGPPGGATPAPRAARGPRRRPSPGGEWARVGIRSPPAPTGRWGRRRGGARGRSPGAISWNELSQVGNDHIGPRPTQRLGVPVAIDAHHRPEVPADSGFDPGDGVLHDHAPLRMDTHAASRLQEGVGGWLPGQALVRGHEPVDEHFEAVANPGRFQDRAGVLRRGDDSAADSQLVEVVEQCQRAGEHLDAVLGEDGVEQLVLLVADRTDGSGSRF